MLSTYVRCLVCAGVLLVGTTAPAVAQTVDKRVIFDFSGAFTLPGVTLPAGKYLFRVPDAMSSRNLVQVLSADGAKIYGTFFAIPAYRTVVPEKPELRFMETPVGMTHAIRTWWYPADSTGFEFIYPKDQALRLAQGGGEPVLTTKGPSTTAAETKTDDLTRVSSTGQETSVDPKAKVEPRVPSESGEVASPSIVIPSNPGPAKVDE
jgi:hypothetical protein